MRFDPRSHESGCGAADAGRLDDRSGGGSRREGLLSAVLVSSYDMGRQPFGLASPAAWLREAGVAVRLVDLSLEKLDAETVSGADVVAFHVPMHTATRIAIEAARKVRRLAPRARLCFYGLYAPLNEARLRAVGGEGIIGGEFERELVEFVLGAAEHAPPAVGEGEPRRFRAMLPRLRFKVPERRGLPALDHYAHVVMPDGSRRAAGYTEASRGCRHKCRHCPIVPVYEGQFRVVQREIVLEDVAQQVAAGARHVTFGDPDFLNGPGHAIPLVRALHERFPRVTYDVTIKIEHLLRHEQHLRTLRDTGCLFVTSAVESIDDEVLELLDKGHTRGDFVRAVGVCREAGLTLSPTFLPFHPWTSLEGYVELLDELERLELVDAVAPVQLSIRLLIPAGSRLLELEQVSSTVAPFDERLLVHPWRHEDARVDALQAAVAAVAGAGKEAGGRRERFEEIRRLAESAAGRKPGEHSEAPRRTPIPYLEEPWYC